MRLVFLGTPAFAVPTLEQMVAAGHDVAAVVTQPDRPRGRGQQLAAPPVKETAVRFGIPVYQPERVRRPEALEYLRTLAPQAMVVVGYGQIIPQSVIDLAPLGIINVHGSLLPKYRGAGPIQWAIVRGETRTGVTTMRIDAGLDTGEMLLKAETEIGTEENAVELGRRLAAMGAELLVRTLDGLASGEIMGEKQDDSAATYAPLLKKEDGAIDWNRPAREIHNQVRGLQPWPGAYTSFRGQKLHLWRTRVAEGMGEPGGGGPVLSARPLVVQCGSGSLELLDVQMEGRKRVPAGDFANGQRLTENEVLGETHA
ncbi:10-formyltetrahydrofolate:L-methionyl-tRNA(fMet) N-formyltransferase [Candidatus Sulfopaludibacter sp. SbA3]|nr:10-formyltetrahydrofolate:L-methionyl-tRNA(fMet) N-formyltransferase [Candidatus Sulfopaludibacter sp. SbA3]